MEAYEKCPITDQYSMVVIKLQTKILSKEGIKNQHEELLFTYKNFDPRNNKFSKTLNFSQFNHISTGCK